MNTDTKPMGIVEMVRRIGDENIQLQALGVGYFEANENSRDCKISFATEKGTALKMEADELIGLVLWIKRKDYNSARSANLLDEPIP